MTTDDIKTVSLVINSAQANKKLDELMTKLDQTRVKRERALERGDADALKVYSREMRRLETEINRVETRAKTVTRVLTSLDQATPKQLQQTIREINRELSSGKVRRGSAEWNSLNSALRAASTELSKIKAEQREVQSMTNRIADWGNKWMGIAMNIQAVFAGLDALKSTMSGLVKQYADMQEHMSAVRKYTGLETEAIEELNEAFMSMDTRTSRQKLNDLAGDAGRLGIQAKDKVLDFVEAANMINVALGKELGEDAVKNIGKLAQLFGDEQTLGLKQAMLSTGSVINELAQTSSAAESYLLEFTARLSGVGNQAGMTQAQIMAFASILDQGMVRVEKGATALQNVITALYRQPAKMAAAAGLDVQKFTKLLSEDGNEAVLTFIDALSKVGSMEVLAPLLKEMKLSGSGVTMVMTTLANNIDAVRATQEQATQAYKEGVSVVNEYNVANNTVQAGLEKAQGRFTDMAVQLGEKLQPIATSIISSTSLFLKTLRVLIEFTASHTAAIVTASAAITAYAVAVNLATVRQTLHTVATRAGAVAMRLFNTALVAGRLAVVAMTYGVTGLTRAWRVMDAAMKTNVIGLVVSLLGTAAVAIAELISRNKEAANAQKQANAELQNNVELEKQANQSIAGQVSRVKLLSAVVRDNNRSIQDRRKAIEQLRKIIPGYNADLSDEGRLTRENTAAIKDYINMLKQKAKAQVLQQRYEAVFESQMNNQLSIERRQAAVQKRRNALTQWGSEEDNRDLYEFFSLGGRSVSDFYAAYYNIDGGVFDRARDEYDKLVASIKEAEGWVDEVASALRKNQNKEKQLEKLALENGVLLQSLTDSQATITPGTGGDEDFEGGVTDTAKEAVDKRLRQQEMQIEQLARQKQLQARAMYAAGQTDLLSYRQQLNDIEIETLEKKRDLYSRDSANWLTHQAALEQARENQAKQTQDWSLQDLERQQEEEEQALKLSRAKGLVSEEEYQERLNNLTVDYLQRRITFLRKSGRAEEAESASQELADTLFDQKLLKERSYQESLQSLREEYAKKSPEEIFAIEQATLEELHQQGLVSEEEYQKLLQSIRLKYQGLSGNGGEIGAARQARAEELLSSLGYGNETPSAGADASADFGVSGLAAAAAKIAQATTVYDKLQELREQDLISEQEYNDACTQLDKQRWNNFTALAQAAFASVSSMMSAAASLYSAQQSLEVAQIEAKYDAEIDAAGDNSTRATLLEEKKQKEIAAVKNKYNKKQMAVEIAQAIAQTAMNALLAYGAMANIPVVGPALAIAAAAAATAAGMIQIAAIKKQHQAEAAGYYEGGYTGGTDYDKEAGVVHEGEFVANRKAVNNPHVRPVLDLIDRAQRTNTIGSLSAEDVSRTISAPQETAVATAETAAAPALQVIDTSSADTAATLRRLSDRLDEGIVATVSLDGENGLDRQWKRYNSLKNRT